MSGAQLDPAACCGVAADSPIQRARKQGVCITTARAVCSLAMSEEGHTARDT